MAGKNVLEKKNRDFFYEIFSQYETENSHNGYDIRRIDKDLKKKIILKHKSNIISHPSTKNTMLYTGNSVVVDLMRHLRNAFAHCYIKDTGKEFLFYDQHSGNCTMDGRMDKPIFYKLIKELNRTRR